ncbi:hypothetical protein AVEN_269327-1 [Araneus ventricosus]|uniref:Uncharacterized protein n=1 Tax=Araneus ventricosus TaxID=182803 RepID=A0A4Y2TS52_ARAVE|nr:hypothetical protein AVEN_269327-1 [Araneus ventricosus]
MDFDLGLKERRRLEFEYGPVPTAQNLRPLSSAWRILTPYSGGESCPCHLFNRHPPARSRYSCEGPGAAIRFKGERKDQTALARLSSGHLRTLIFSRGDKKFDICTKCNMTEAAPQHLLDCVASVYDGLLKRPDFVLEVMRANDLLDLI